MNKIQDFVNSQSEKIGKHIQGIKEERERIAREKQEEQERRTQEREAELERKREAEFERDVQFLKELKSKLNDRGISLEEYLNFCLCRKMDSLHDSNSYHFRNLDDKPSSIECSIDQIKLNNFN
jgi:hypothetical protein